MSTEKLIAFTSLDSSKRANTFSQKSPAEQGFGFLASKSKNGLNLFSASVLKIRCGYPVVYVTTYSCN
ncbi:hypothetical protein [Pseudanabaena sp. lw0831]|uniref:hypothetical protein n=1 Tax=Pseudanabaena sp. lw0831 TaxID=1357935 RepID=UPI001F2C7EF1|nr:hypothetical protein [Pseudanabaena sp. lw0831]